MLFRSLVNGRTVDEVRQFLGVDSLHYLSLDGLLKCMQRPAASYCTACWSGDYPLDPSHPVGDEVVEHDQLRMFT